jgi:NAD(P)-dependent dehydrogenase (short-subunit alcohol dehydrogenase family)
MRGLTGKAAIVTGGAHGIGRAIAQRLCSEGVSVTFTDLSEDGVAVQEEGLARHWSLQFVQGDMADERFCRAAVAAAVSKWGGVDFLVNNAFSFLAKGMDATREDWHRMMEVGPIAYATMGQCAADAMKARGGGAIVNISSISAHIAQPNRWTYNAAKGAVNQLTRCMAMDLAPCGIRVNTLSPGWIWTREVDKACGGDRTRWGPVWGKYHILRRLGNVEEIAGPTAFLLSDEASFITGAELAVDGGYLALGSEGLGDTSTFAGSA